MSYMIHDDHGNVWPPQFRSELCSPDSPRSMLSHNAKQRAMAAANAASNEARAQGKGWQTGTMSHLQKPLIPQPKEGRSGALKSLPERTTGFPVRWSCGNCAKVWTTTAGSSGKGGAKVCADCVAAKAGRAA